MNDNPSPEKIQARADVRKRVEDTWELASNAFCRIRSACDEISVSETLLGSTARAKLYEKLSQAQEDYATARKDHADALVAYYDYFQPI